MLRPAAPRAPALSALAHGAARSVGAPRQQRRWARTTSLTATVVAALVLSLLALPEPRDPGPVDVPLLVEHALGRAQTDFRSARPPYLPEPTGHLTTASPPAAVVGAVLVSKSVLWQQRRFPYLVPDSALPFRYRVDRRLAERYGLENVIDAMAQWDGVPGSRWSTEFVSVVDHRRDRPRSDGRSVVYLRDDCRRGFLGGALWNTSPERAHVDVRYGMAAIYSPQVDIAVCAEVESLERLRGVLAHEVGHAMGQAHLCAPGEICWRSDMADRRRRCRVMYHRWGPCREGITGADHDAVRHLYPTLPRLYGPDPARTAARASYATTWTHTAETVVLARDDGRPDAGVLAAALSGTVDGPLLLATPDPRRCLTGAAASELSRAATSRGRVVLVGGWPAACDERLAAWNLDVERVDPPVEAGHRRPRAPAPRLSVQIANRVHDRLEEDGAPPEAALLVPVDSRTLPFDGAAAAAAAGSRGLPLLLSEPTRLSPAVRRWLLAHPNVERVYVLGGVHAANRVVLGALRDVGVRPVFVSGATPVDRAAVLAARQSPAPPLDADGPVVVAPVGSWQEAVVGASLAARTGASLLLSPDRAHPAVLDWLRRRRPRGGYVVGRPDSLPYPLQWEYTGHVAGADEPLPSRADAPRLRFGFSALAP